MMKNNSVNASVTFGSSGLDEDPHVIEALKSFLLVEMNTL
jgi:hypothetical protein